MSCLNLDLLIFFFFKMILHFFWPQLDILDHPGDVFFILPCVPCVPFVL